MARTVTTVETYDWDAKSKEWVAKTKTVTETVDEKQLAITVQPPSWPYPYRAVWSASSSMKPDPSRYLAWNGVN